MVSSLHIITKLPKSDGAPFMQVRDQLFFVSFGSGIYLDSSVSYRCILRELHAQDPSMDREVVDGQMDDLHDGLDEWMDVNNGNNTNAVLNLTEEILHLTDSQKYEMTVAATLDYLTFLGSLLLITVMIISTGKTLHGRCSFLPLFIASWSGIGMVHPSLTVIPKVNGTLCS